MGNFTSSLNEGCLIPQTNFEDRVLINVDVDDWNSSLYEQFNFPKPCVEHHSDNDLPYSKEKCYLVEMSGSRRRMREWRQETSRLVLFT